jgi:hypothetical protein
MFNSQLSRVVTKLFTRVIKAEESSLQPFSSACIDTEALICTLEDALVACERAEEDGKAEDAIAASKHLAKILLLAILKARGEIASLRSEMDELGIDPGSSAIGKLVESCTTELGLSTSSPVRESPKDIVVSSVSADFASLVSAVGSAPQGPEREAAIDMLRKYKATHGDAELNNRLAKVSYAFRAFVLEQLSENTANNQAPEPSKASSMSERIKNLRSKINATEAVVQSACKQCYECVKKIGLSGIGKKGVLVAAKLENRQADSIVSSHMTGKTVATKATQFKEGRPSGRPFQHFYKKEDKLGQGGFATVYRCAHKRPGLRT